MYYTYILRSTKTKGAIYIGSTSDIKKRLWQHNAGENIYTNKHRPWAIEGYFAFTTKATAENFEKYLKTNSGKAFLVKRLISSVLASERDQYKNGRKQGLH